MAIEFKEKPMNWQNEGTEPSDTLKKNGFEAGYKPPADVFNYQFNNTTKCIEEIQTQMSNLNGTDGGFNSGTGATATTGGAIGTIAQATTGGAVGHGAKATAGGAVGFNAQSENGGAVGASATATTGGAVGVGANATKGFSGGQMAKATVDAIQLGTGTNEEEKTLKVYDYQMMNANGKIPVDRIFSKTSTITKTLTAGSQIMHILYPKEFDNSVMFVEVVEATANNNFVPVIAYPHYDTVNSQQLISVQRGTGVASNSEISYTLKVFEIGF